MGFIEETGAAQYLPRCARDRDLRRHQRHSGDGPCGPQDDGRRRGRLPPDRRDRRPAPRPPAPPCPIWPTPSGTRPKPCARPPNALLAQDMNDRFAGAVPYLRAFARVLGAHFHLRAALADAAGAARRLARVAIRRLLPEHAAPAGAGARRGGGALCPHAEDLLARDGRARGIRHPFDAPPAEGDGDRGGAGHPVDAPAAADGAGSCQCLCAGRWRWLDRRSTPALTAARPGRSGQALMAGPLAGKPGPARGRHASSPRPHRPCGLVSGARGGTDHHPHRMALRADAGAGCAAAAHGRSAGLLARAPGWRRPCWPSARPNARSTSADVVAPLPLGFTRIAEGDGSPWAGGAGWCASATATRPNTRRFWSLDDDLVLGGDQLLPGDLRQYRRLPDRTRGRPAGRMDGQSPPAFSPMRASDHLVLPGHKLPFHRPAAAAGADGRKPRSGRWTACATHLATPRTRR